MEARTTVAAGIAAAVAGYCAGRRRGHETDSGSLPGSETGGGPTKQAATRQAPKRRALVNVKQPFERAAREGYKQFLETVPLLSTMKATDLERLACMVTAATFADGDVIMQQGEDGDSMYILQEGKVAADIHGKVVKEYSSTEYFGERVLVGDGNKKRAATVKSMGASVCLQLRKEAFAIVLAAGALRAAYPVMRTRSTDEKAEQAAAQLVLISDPGQDLDDEMAFIMCRHLVDCYDVVLKGVITTLNPAFDRARLTRGTLDMLGLHNVPVGIGTDGGDTKGVHSARSFEFLASSYLPDPESESTATLEPGRRLLHCLWQEAAPRSLTMVVIASLKDAALFLRDNESLFLAKTKEVIIMGGVEQPDHAGTEGSASAAALCPQLIPDDAHNNQFDRAASEYFYRRCQELGVPMIVVSRWAAYAVQMPRSTYDELALTGSSIGFRLRSAQRDTIEQLWQRACAPAGSDARKGLPGRCDRTWFLATFCGGSDGVDPQTEHVRGGGDSVWDLVVSFNQYDTIALLAAVPELRQKFFEPLACQVAALTISGNVADATTSAAVTHQVIGTTKESTGVRDEGKPALLKLLKQGYVDGLKANLRLAKEQLVVLTGSHQHEHDTRLMCLTIRALYGMGNVSCLGVVVDDGHSTTGAAEPNGAPAIEEGCSMREILDELGLHHVKVLTSSSAVDGEDPNANGPAVEQHIADLYGDALPSGVCLVVTSAATAAAAFASANRELFRSQTAKVILVGDALRRTSGRDELVPDPDGANWCTDLAAAKNLFAVAQEQVRVPPSPLPLPPPPPP